MNEKVLYYPYIEIPDNSWLRSTILYNEAISTIIPSDSWKPTDLEKILNDNGIYDPIYASDIVFNDEYRELEKTFLKVIESKEFRKFRNKNKEFQQKLEVSIHVKKMSYSLFDNLKKMKLVGEEENDNFYRIDAVTSLTYMSLLATLAAKIDKANTHLTTDNEDLNRIIFKNSNLKKSKSLLVNTMLPVLSSDIKIIDIIKFRNKYKDLFLVFKNEYQSLTKEFKGLTEIDDLKEASYTISLRIKKGLIEVEKAMNLEKKKYLKKCLSGVIGSTSSLAIASALDFSIKDSLIISSITGILNVAIESIAFPFEKDDKLEFKSYSYLYKAKMDNIIQV